MELFGNAKNFLQKGQEKLKKVSESELAQQAKNALDDEIAEAKENTEKLIKATKQDPLGSAKKVAGHIGNLALGATVHPSLGSKKGREVFKNGVKDAVTGTVHMANALKKGAEAGLKEYNKALKKEKEDTQE